VSTAAPSIENYLDLVRAHLATLGAPEARAAFLERCRDTVDERFARGDVGRGVAGAFLMGEIVQTLEELLAVARNELFVARRAPDVAC